MVVLYIICEFLVIYFSVKIFGKEMKRKVREERDCTDWSETKEFWIIIALIIFWVILIPSIILWKALDKVTDKYFNKNKQ